MNKMEFRETERITHHLMLNAYFTQDLGLFHGQMGIILAMSEYSKYADNEVYFDIASYLLDNIMEKMHKNMTYSFSSGLSGIGWGIEYLVQHGFVAGKSVEICEEIDWKIMETDLERITDLSLDTGLEGLLHYILYHLQGAIKQNAGLPFDEKYLSGLYAACILLKEQTKDAAIKLLLDVYVNFYDSGIIKGYNTSIIDYVTVESAGLSKKSTIYPLGLKDGLSGKLLKIIFA